MRLIAIADIHGKQYRVNNLIKNVEEFSPEVVVICGDITHFGPGELAKVLLDQIPVKTLAIHGNIDSEDVLDYIDKSKAENIHLREYIYKDLKFVGLGGNHFSDDEIKEVKSLLDENSIFVTHLPPYKVLDNAIFGIHAGSREIRQIIEEKKPRLHLCGHIHERPGFDRLNSTIVVNCSAGKSGSGALIDIDDEISVKMLE